MWIYLLRHGIAEDACPGTSDDERALTDEGRDRLHRAAKAWRKLVAPPQIVMASPLLRARQTASAFASAVDFADEIRIEEALVPSARTELLMGLLEEELLTQTDSVAVVGHEPHLGYLLGTLLTGHPRVSIPLKKGMLVAVQTESASNLMVGLRFSLSQKAAGKFT